MELGKRIIKMREFTTLLLVTVIFLLVGLINPSFLSVENIMLCLNGSVVFTLLTAGSAFVIITGEIDVSVGATLGLAAAVAGSMIRSGSSFLIASLVAILIGLIAGLVNGFGVTVLKVPSIIMTLGTNGIIRGIVYLYTGGKWIENIPLWFKSMAQLKIGDITWFYLISLIIVIALTIWMLHTRTGIRFAAVGDNPSGATLLGISVFKTKMLAYALCGVFAAIAGVLVASRTGFITPATGNGYEMKAIAACVLGGVSLTGGTGSLIGASLGAIIMASIGRILVFLQFPSDYDNMITGLLLITIVVLDGVYQMRSEEKSRRERLDAKFLVDAPKEG